MEWITTIIKANTGEDGKVNIAKVEEQLKVEAPKNVVPKDQYNAQAEKLKAATDKATEAEATIEQLKKDNGSNEDLQKQIAVWKAKAETADEEIKQITIKAQAETALREAGAKDVEYALFKLGELELDQRGNVKNLSVQVKSLQESTPAIFETKEGEGDKAKGEPDGKGGYKPLDNSLNKGKGGEDEMATAAKQLEAAMGVVDNTTT
jgi:hypothetical protein